MKILLELDHQANAASVDLTLPPTKIIFFGNPKLGTPLMQSGTLTGLDLPKKILVTERNGVVSISYNDPNYLKDRHQIIGQDEVLQKVITACSLVELGKCSSFSSHNEFYPDCKPGRILYFYRFFCIVVRPPIIPTKNYKGYKNKLREPIFAIARVDRR